MTVDFHVHSTASDGTFPPAEIVRLAQGFRAIALTDHDNCDGLSEFLSAPAEPGLVRVAGIELSIDPGAGFDRFHLLGLGVDPANAPLRAFLRRVLVGRDARNERILANFARLGIEIAPDDIARYAHGEVLARPHFANWLIDHGFASDKSEAFAKYLADDAPRETNCYVKRWHPSQEEAFAVIHGAGGLCVMAHPRFWRSDWKRVGCDFAAAERELARLKEVGLDGIEALYQANTSEENVEFARIAGKLGFLMSAGSDFHGEIKRDIPLGMEVSEDFIRPLLERLLPTVRSRDVV